MIVRSAFWEAGLSNAEHSLIFYFLVIAGLALLAQFVRTLVSQGEIGSRYRPATLAGMSITGIAFLSYVVLVIKFDLGYDQRGDSWVPNSDAILSFTPRYMDWSITVPLLMIELIAVSTLAGALARRVRTVAIAAAFLMIFTGYLGGVVIGDGDDLGALWLWGVISGVFMVILYVLIAYVLVKSTRELSSEIASTYRAAAILLFVVWFAYPIAFGFQGYNDRSGAVTAGVQIALSVADIIAKVGFGALIHKVAKLRTAEDVAAGQATHPEAVWTSNVHRSDARLPAMSGTSSSTAPQSADIRTERRTEPTAVRRDAR